MSDVLLFDGTPQHAPGQWNGKLGFIYPPWDALENGGLAIPRPPQCQIVLDDNGRFPGKPYWRFETAPGDKYQQQSGERVLLIRPETHQQGGVKTKPEELPGIDSSGTPPWGETRAFAMSVKFRADFGVPHSWLLLWQQKMSQYNFSPFASLSIRSELDVDGGLPLGSTDHLKLFLIVDSGPFDGKGFLPAYKRRRLNAPNAIDTVQQEQWYDIGWELKYANDQHPGGYAYLWWKKAEDAAWTKVVYVENDWVGQWPVDRRVNFTTFSQGIYRGDDRSGATHVTWQTGCEVAKTFAELAPAYAPSVGPAQRLNPRVVTDAQGTWLETDKSGDGLYVYRKGVFATRTFTPGKRIKLEKAGAPAPPAGSVTARPADITLGPEEVAT